MRKLMGVLLLAIVIVASLAAAPVIGQKSVKQTLDETLDRYFRALPLAGQPGTFWLTEPDGQPNPEKRAARVMRDWLGERNAVGQAVIDVEVVTAQGVVVKLGVPFGNIPAMGQFTRFR